MLNSPFTQAGARNIASKGLLKGSKFTFNGIVTNLEKTVSTINQVVPLYNQVKPLISNSKTIINAFKSTRNNNPNKKRNNKANKVNPSNFDPNIINVEVKEPTYTNTIKEKEVSNTNIFTSIDTPNKPFFI